MSMTESDTLKAVQEAVVGALGVSDDEASPDATLMDDLGAESIDLLDILFRIERSTGVKIQASDLSDYIQGGISDDKFSDENEVITPEGMEHLKRIMPQLDADALQGELKAEDVIKHFTVQNLAGMVSERSGGGE
jgi:acyl carrier protein